MWVGLIGLSLLSIVILNFSGDAVPGDRLMELLVTLFWRCSPSL